MASVTLLSPQNTETTVSSAGAFNNLVYGQGYRPKTGTIAANIAALLGDPGQPVPDPFKALTVADIGNPTSEAGVALRAAFVPRDDVQGVVEDVIAESPAVQTAAVNATTSAAQGLGYVVAAPSKNLYDLSADTNDKYINNFGALVTLAGYRASDFIPIVAGQTYTINVVRNFARYDASKVFVAGTYLQQTAGVYTFTAAANGYVRFSYVATTFPPATVQAEKGSAVTAVEPFARYLDGYSLRGGNPLTVTRLGSDISVRTLLGTEQLTINATLAGQSNAIFNYLDARLGSTIVHAMGDEPGPIRTQHGTIGANHGFSQLAAYPAVAHDKTTADLGSLWTDGTRQYVLLAIDSTGRAIFGGSYTTDGAGVVRMVAATPTTDLTHVSGSTHTAVVPAAQRAGLGTVQMFPGSTRKRQTVLLDGVTLADGISNGRELEIRESYEVLDYGSLYDLARANIGVSYTTLPVAGCVRVDTVTRIRQGGVATVDVELTELRPTELGVCGFVQSVVLSGTVTRYLPGVKTIGLNNWSTGVAMAGYSSTQLVTTADLHNPAAPPVVCLDVRSDIGFALGYKPWAPGSTRSPARLTETPTQLWDMRSSKKSYPTAIYAEPAGWGHYEGHALRAYLTPTQAAAVAAAGTDANAAYSTLTALTVLP